MPFYEYRCNECGEAFEKMLRFSEAHLSPVCPICKSPDTHKKISKVAAIGIATAGAGNASGGSCAPRGGFS